MDERIHLKRLLGDKGNQFKKENNTQRDIKVPLFPKWYQDRRSWTSKAHKAAVVDIWPCYGRSEQNKTLKFGVHVDFDDWFKNKLTASTGCRRTLDIGFGTGDALVELARKHPDEEFVGCEIYKTGHGNIALQLRELEIENVRLIGGDVRKFLMRQCPKYAFNDVNIFFPDPFSKNTSLRLVDSHFIHLLTSKMRFRSEKYSLGKCHINFASDVADYCLEILKLMADLGEHVPWQLASVNRSSGPSENQEIELRDREDESSNAILEAVNEFFPTAAVDFSRTTWRPTTHFECLAQGEGRFIWDLHFQENQESHNMVGAPTGKIVIK